MRTINYCKIQNDKRFDKILDIRLFNIQFVTLLVSFVKESLQFPVVNYTIGSGPFFEQFLQSRDSVLWFLVNKSDY